MDITKRRITKIAREVNRFTVSWLKEEGIGSSELDVLHAVRKNPGITQATICQRLGMDKGAVARQTANLEAKGYLTRTQNPKDKRSYFLFPTSKADQLKNSKANIEATFYEWLLEEMPAEDKQEFVRLLDRIYLRCKTESKADFVHMNAVMERNKDEK